MELKDFNIIHLPKEEWEGVPIPMRYTTEEYYDVRIVREEDGYSTSLKKCRFEAPIHHYPEEYDFPDKLYQPHWEKAYAWGIVEEKDGKKELLACIETCPEEWSNRLMVTELWVHEKIRRKGVAHALMAIAKEQAVLEHRRAIILETQSCNTGAIAFYQKEGFELIGFDSCCYSNRDIERREVRINMGYFTRKEEIKMESAEIVFSTDKKEMYKEVALHLKGLIDGVPHKIANLANASALLNQALDKINWVGFYLMQDGKLVLGPFQGKPACIEIKVGRGVCGTAVEKDEVMLVEDVHKFSGHIACDAASKSEIVVPIHVNGEIVGVLDIDSPFVARFDETDREGLMNFVEVLEQVLASNL